MSCQLLSISVKTLRTAQVRSDPSEYFLIASARTSIELIDRVTQIASHMHIIKQKTSQKFPAVELPQVSAYSAESLAALRQQQHFSVSNTKVPFITLHSLLPITTSNIFTTHIFL